MTVCNLTKENFKKEALLSDKPVLIDFWAKWCGPCRMMSPIVDQIAAETNDVKVCKVDVDDQAELASVFQVMSIPTLVLLKDGKRVHTSVGVKPKQEIMQMLSK